MCQDQRPEKSYLRKQKNTCSHTTLKEGCKNERSEGGDGADEYVHRLN